MATIVTNTQVFRYSIAVFLLLAIHSYGQEHNPSPKNKAKYETSLKYIEAKRTNEAIALLQDLVKADPEFLKAKLLLANVYFYTKKDSSLAAINYNDLAINNRNFSYLPHYNLGKIMLGRALYAKAQQFFIDARSISDFPEYETKKWKIYSSQARFGDSILHLPHETLNITHLGYAINSINDEFTPNLTADGLTMIFTRSVKGAEDFFESEKIDGLWTEANALMPPINSSQNEGAQSLSPDGKHIYFTGCNRSGGLGKCDIYYSIKQGEHWTEVQNLGVPINSSYWETQPSISANGKYLFFVSDRPGGIGGSDIWVSFFNGQNWEQPKNLGPKVNTILDEFNPFIHADNHTLYFSSDGRPGMGKQDLYKAYFDVDSVLSEAQNLGFPINNQMNQNGIFVSSDGNEGLIAAQYDKGFGGSDIYSFTLPEIDKPSKVYYLKGVTKDKDTRKNIGCRLQVRNLNTGEIAYETQSDAVNGQFLVCLKANSSYVFNGYSTGYMIYSVQLKLDSNFKSNENYDIYLEPITNGLSTVLKNVFFDIDAAYLSKASYSELDNLIKFLKLNPTVSLRIEGHTDNTGNEIYNKNLSIDRAKAVYDYLIKCQIPAQRLEYKGYGSTKPVAENNTDFNRQLNRRTQIVILAH